MSSENLPPGPVPIAPGHHLAPLRSWAFSPRAEADLETIFGKGIDWTAASRWLAAFRDGDFSGLPRIHTLPAADMPGLWGGYSRERRAIYISTDCPPERETAVLIEEIGHFLDHEICSSETPGDEGSQFARAILRDSPFAPAHCLDFPDAKVFINGSAVAVEASGKILVQSTSSPKAPLVGTTGNDTFVIHSPVAEIQDYLDQGDIDLIQASTSISLLNYGTVENLTFTGSANLNGTGNIKDNSITGNAGNNIIDGGSGSDTILGLGGSDYLYGGGGGDSILGGDGSDTIFGATGNNTLDGGSGNDSLVAALGSSSLVGGSGDDTLVATVGSNILLGGVGNDVYFIESLDTQILEFENQGDDTLYTTNRNILKGMFPDVEHVIYITADGIPEVPTQPEPPSPPVDGKLILGNELNNSLSGDGGPDTLRGFGGNDTLRGLSGDDTLEGGEGSDLLDGGSGVDSMSGGAGHDKYMVDAGGDIVTELSGEGTDSVLSPVSYTLSSNVEVLELTGSANLHATGNSGNNTLLGNLGNNSLIAVAGDNYLNGRSGKDTLVGGSGNDTFLVGDAEDSIFDTGGIDWIHTPLPEFSLLGLNSIEHLKYTGTLVPASLTGNSLANSIVGGSLSDTLAASSSGGTDTLVGGWGDDVYITSRQSDRVVEETVENGGIDIVLTTSSLYSIADFEGVERLRYNGASNSTLLGNSANNTIEGAAGVRNTIAGATGNDYLVGGNLTDSLAGGEGNDTLIVKRWVEEPAAFLGPQLGTGGGSDILSGGPGDDWYVVNSQTAYQYIEDSLSGGKDTIASTVSFSLDHNPTLASAFENLFLVGQENLTGTGNSLANTISGNDGNNSLRSGAAADSIVGGLGGDQIFGEQGNDTLVGGGSPQTDIPAGASTPVTIRPGQIYSGTFELDRTVDKIDSSDTDWIRAELDAGVEYVFELRANLSGGINELNSSTLSMGSPRRGASAGIDGIGSIVVGDRGVQPENINLGGLVGEGVSGTYAATSSIYLYVYLFTPGEIYIPISLNGPSTGSYELRLPTGSDPVTAIIADDASNTLVGGEGRDSVVAGNGRDSVGNAIGDKLFGGTNGVPGGRDLDTLLGENIDTLVGGAGPDLLDGGDGEDSLVGGKGDDTYYIDRHIWNRGDQTVVTGDSIIEYDDGGQNDLVVVNTNNTPFRKFEEDLKASQIVASQPTGIFGFLSSSSGLDSTTGAGFDIDLSNTYANLEHASLMGSGNLYVLGNSEANSLFGNFGNNFLTGGDGSDSLIGEGGDDYLVGGEGADLLDGVSGSNTLVGGAGADTYIVNDRNDRIAGEQPGLDGGEDIVRTRFNFDPIQGSALEQFQPNQPDNSPSVTKSPSFASLDLKSFYNLEHFVLLDQAAYGVGNSLNNSMSAADGTAALLLGMGGDDSLLGGSGADSLHGDTPRFYAKPDLYAPAPTDTRTQEFVDGIGLTLHGNDYLEGGAGDDHLDGGRGFDTMVGGAGTNVFIQDHVDDYIVATGGSRNELVSSVNISRAPDGINDIMLVVKDQDRDENRLLITGQEQAASFASFLGSTGGNQGAYTYEIGTVEVSVSDANSIELMYSHNVGDTYRSNPTKAYHLALNVGTQRVDEKDNTKVVHELSWSAGPFDALGVVGYTVKYRKTEDEMGNPFFDSDGNPGVWKTYLDGTAQDLRGTQTFPSLMVDNLDPGEYEFEVVSNRLAMPVVRDFEDPASETFGDALREQVVTLQGGAGNDFLSAQKLVNNLPGGLVDDTYNDPLVQNNPLDTLPLGFLFAPEPVIPNTARQTAFAAYLEGGAGNDLLVSARANGGLGVDYEFQGVTFSGLNTMVGGLGSDTFVVKNGGQALGDGFDWVFKYGNETPVDYGSGGVGASLNGGQHNLVVSAVPFLTLSDTVVSQGKFIDQLALASGKQFGMGNRLDNFIADGLNGGGGGSNTLVGGLGRDSIQGGAGDGDVLIGGTAYGKDDVGFTVRDFASVIDGGNGLTNSIFRDTDPIPVDPSGPGVADPSQFWFVPGFYGGVYDPNRNQDTLTAGAVSTLDGGAGKDSMVGSASDNQVAPGRGDMFFVSQGQGGVSSQAIGVEDAVYGNNGNDTVMFTDSDYLWWSGHSEGSLLEKHGYTIAQDISNLILQAGSPSARNATGNNNSEGNFGQGSNIIQGNEFDNILNGSGVGGSNGKGTGVDILIGGSGKDNFVVAGYTGSDSNSWSPKIIDYEDGPLAGQSVWVRRESVYTDADYKVIRDFEAGDNLQLSGPAAGYWIGAAPESDGIPSSFENNLPLLGYLERPNPTRFGIYTAGTPNLVAIVNTVGNLALDTLTLQLAFDPAPSNTVATTSPFRDVLGFGTFWKLEGSNFAQYVNQAYSARDSFASLSTLVRSGNDNFVGGALADSYNGYGGNDSLLGGSGNDTLLGDADNDTLLGQAGNDSLLGGDGADSLDGGTGNDQLIGGRGDDTFVVDALADTVSENPGEGTDSVLASISGYALAANVENLALTGTAIDGAGNGLHNRLTGNASNNTLAGLAGDDTLDGGAGTDTLQGGGGNDLYLVDNSNDTIEDTNGTDSVRASAGFDLSNPKVAGGTGIEHLVYTGTTTGVSLAGNINANSIIGGAGSDTIEGKGDKDTLVGGFGNDFYVLVTGDTDLVVEDPEGGTDTALVSGNFSLLTLDGGANVENLELIGTAGASLYGNALGNLIVGNIGDDTLDGLQPGLNGDSLFGGAGNDVYIVDSTTDYISDSGGTADMVRASVSFDLSNTLVGNGTEIEHLTFTASNSATLTGNILSNSIRGGSGADLMTGGKGSDTYFATDDDSIVEESLAGGNDWVVSSSTYRLGDYIENLLLDGISGIHGTGNSLGNSLFGNSGNNSLDGVAGNPTLAVYDNLIGGDGNDTYTVHNQNDLVVEANPNSLVGGNDLVFSNVSYTLAENVERLILVDKEKDAPVSGVGNAINNTLIGNSISNSLDGGLGNDSMVGGAGNDTYFVDALADAVFEKDDEGGDWVVASVSGYTLGSNLENLRVAGTFEAGVGNALENLILGNASNNSLNGAGGVDTLIGGAGNDTYVVDSNADLLEDSGGTDDMVRSSVSFDLSNTLAGGGTAIEHLEYTGSAASTLSGNARNNSIIGGAGNDSIAGNGGNDTFIGNNGNDTYLVDSAGDLVLETSPGGGNDLVVSSVSYTIAADNYVDRVELSGSAVFAVGNSLNNTFVGNALGNSLDGGTGNDSMVGGEGNDTYVVDNASDIVRETEADSLLGGIDLVRSGVDFTLGANLERLELTGATAVSGVGNALGNTLTGNFLGNSLDGRGGADSLVGGGGNDTYIVDNAADAVFENAGEGTDLVVSSVSYALGAEVDQLTLAGTAVSATGNTLANTLTGNAVGNSLDGGAGIDSLVGGEGNDTYFVDDSSDAVYEVGGQGTDLALVSADNYTLSSDVENLTYIGTGNATFVGNASANIIDARVAGTNSLVGGGGNDTLIVDASRVGTVNGGNDQDTLRFVGTAGMTLGDSDFGGFAAIESFSFSEVSGDIKIEIGSSALGLNIATLAGGTGNDTFDATAYTIASTLSGGDGNDSLLSGTGNDSLTGGNGTDWLQGTSASSKGAKQFDTLTGGAGSDTFILGDSGFAFYNSAETDTPVDYAVITDFANGDKLQLKTIDGTLDGNGYLVFGVGDSKYQLYLDTDKNDVYNSGDNLIAEITSSVALSTANLKSTHGSFV